MGFLNKGSSRLLGIGAIAGGIMVLEALITGRGAVTIALVVASVVMFLSSAWAADRLLGTRAATWFILIALPVGWFAEQMGSSRGWFFGHYTYTDVLGWQLGNVPLVIPLMWFALVFTGYVLSCLMLWRSPVLQRVDLLAGLVTAWLTAMVVTAFDLGADPYFVFVLKAWIMQKKDGGWFGETLQGFVGWMVIAALIAAAWLIRIRQVKRPEQGRATQWAIAIPLMLYGGEMVYQIVFGHPIEIRAIAVFAMGIPLLVSLVGWIEWNRAPISGGAGR